MNQHSVQEAYLKNFCINGRLWVHDKQTRKAELKPASQCTIERDFQSEVLEQYQNRNIESPGIKKLRKITKQIPISEEDFESIKYWIALHIVRSQKFRSAPGVDYNKCFRELIDIENKFFLYYRYCFKLKCADGKYLNTCDNPVLEFQNGDSFNRILTLSPKELILFSPINNTIQSEELDLIDLVNSMSWANSKQYVFSTQKDIPVGFYEQNIEEWNLAPELEEMKFIIE
jgi:hypothetical protein